MFDFVEREIPGETTEEREEMKEVIREVPLLSTSKVQD